MPTPIFTEELIWLISQKQDKLEAGHGLEINNGIIDISPSLLDTYIHNQAAASSDWTINHNLEKYPSVTVVDSAGSAVMGETLYIDANKIRIIFSAPFSGRAYLN
jgi:hypothetical protein